jgi:hypothetical protein
MARKSMRLGGGGRFQSLTSSLRSQGKSPQSANAIAASIGRQKYGGKKMARMAARKRGAKRAARG